MSDDAIVSTIVREEGIVALSSPPSGSLGGLITWLMPGICCSSASSSISVRPPQPASS